MKEFTDNLKPHFNVGINLEFNLTAWKTWKTISSKWVDIRSGAMAIL